jgi:hypothetical protein
MADDAGAQALGILRALNAAGLVQNQAIANPSTSEIISALAEAGLLRIEGRASSTPAPPPGPQVGDVVRIEGIRGVGKYLNPTTGQKYVRLAHSPTLDTTVLTYLYFPPNDESWLPEFDKIIAAPKPLQVMAYVEITSVETTEIHHGKLVSLTVEAWWPS